MTYILNIETATKNCSVSLSENGETIAFKELATESFSHAEKLHVFIADVLKEVNLNFKDLNAIAVSQGPGSYTGLRIGVSSVKGLCYALNLPMISIDTLALLANQISIEEGIIVPMIDARRLEVYAAFYDTNGNQIREIKAEVIDENTYSKISEKMHLVGDGALKLKSILTNDKFIFHDDVVFPSAKEMSKIAFDKYKKSDFVDVAYFEPFYLKDFVLNK